jgi:hypothetical protein
MLNNNHQETANKISTMLMHTGIGLGVKPETPLECLVTSMDPLECEDVVAASNSEGFKERHDANIVDITNIAFDRLMASRSFARNTINPIIREIAELCEEARARLRRETDIFDKDISVIEPLRIFSSSVLEDSYTPFINAQYVTFPDSSSVAILKSEFVVDRFIKAVSNTNDQWNSAISRMLLAAGANSDEIKGIIGSDLNASVVYSNNVGMLRDPVAAINFLYVDAVLSGRYEISEEKNVSDLSRMKGWYGYMLGRQVNAIRDFASARKLVIDGPDEHTIYVYKRRWDNVCKVITANDFLNICVILNCDRREVNAVFSMSDADILEKHAAMAPGIESRIRSNNFKYKVMEGTNLKEIIEFGIAAKINDEDLVEKEDRDFLHGLKREFFSANTLTTNADVLEYIRRAVCYVIGHESSALQLLTDIETYLDDNPDASLEKADIFASTRIITQWLMNQTTIVSVATTAQLLRNEI